MEADFIPTYNDKSIYKSSDPNNTFWAKDQSRFGLKVRLASCLFLLLLPPTHHFGLLLCGVDVEEYGMV